MHTDTPDVYSVTKRTLLLLRQADVLNHTPTQKFPVSPLPMDVEAAQTRRAGTLRSGPGSSVQTTPLCLPVSCVEGT